MPRIIIDRDPFHTPLDHASHCSDNGNWPADWLKLPRPTGVFCFRRVFDLAEPAKLRIHVSADERYELRLDGERLGRGPERSDPMHWCYESWELELAPGQHVFSAAVTALGEFAPWAQMSSVPGFLLAAEEPFGALSTGRSGWEVREMPGIRFDVSGSCYIVATGAVNLFDLALFPADWSAGTGWEPAAPGAPARPASATRHWCNPPYLVPARLPAQIDRLLPIEIEPQTVPAHETRELVIDLGVYACFHPEITLSGSGRATVGATESFFDADGRKVNRRVAAGDPGELHRDIFLAGPEAFPVSPFRFRCGKFLIVKLEAADAPLKLEKLTLRETGYPCEFTAWFRTSDPMFEPLGEIMERTLRLCTHETWMDCPFYEQLMYLGDTRIEALTAGVLGADRRMQRKAAELFGWSRDWRGLTASSYPVRGRQTIPGFSLIWIAMIHDLLMWTPDAEDQVREALPAVRNIIDLWENRRDADGLIRSLPGWNFVTDPVAEPQKWPHSTPPGGGEGEISPVLNMLYLAMSKYAVRLETQMGDPERAAWLQHRRERSAAALKRVAFDAGRNLFADDGEKTGFSEPIQCLAILSEAFPPGTCDAMFDPPLPLARCNFYFSHYYFEACRIRRRPDKFLQRFRDWEQIPTWGLTTTPEGNSDQSRSDCHAWSAGPLFHWYATLAGIRPAAPGFRSVRIEPQLGTLPLMEGVMPHPGGGEIRFRFDAEHATVVLPPGVGGELRFHDRVHPIVPGGSLELRSEKNQIFS